MVKKYSLNFDSTQIIDVKKITLESELAKGYFYSACPEIVPISEYYKPHHDPYSKNQELLQLRYIVFLMEVKNKYIYNQPSELILPFFEDTHEKSLEHLMEIKYEEIEKLYAKSDLVGELGVLCRLHNALYDLISNKLDAKEKEYNEYENMFDEFLEKMALISNFMIIETNGDVNVGVFCAVPNTIYK